jgi:hypothetical protein
MKSEATGSKRQVQNASQDVAWTTPPSVQEIPKQAVPMIGSLLSTHKHLRFSDVTTGVTIRNQRHGKNHWGRIESRLVQNDPISTRTNRTSLAAPSQARPGLRRCPTANDAITMRPIEGSAQPKDCHAQTPSNRRKETHAIRHPLVAHDQDPR